MDFRFRTNIVADKTCKLQIWDTAGAERFRTITSAYYRGAHGIVLMYDITNRQSFDNLDRWIDEVRRHSTDNVVIMVAGLKSDLTEDRQVTESEGQVTISIYIYIYRYIMVIQ